MANGRMVNGNRIQTTVNISQTALDALDGLSNDSLVSRSKLVDLALRRFIRWAQGVSARELKLIVDYEVSEQTGALRQRRMSSLPPSLEEDEPRTMPVMPQNRPPKVTMVEQPARAQVRRKRNRSGRYE